jgi:hypothetical protein
VLLDSTIALRYSSGHGQDDLKRRGRDSIRGNAGAHPCALPTAPHSGRKANRANMDATRGLQGYARRARTEIAEAEK